VFLFYFKLLRYLKKTRSQTIIWCNTK